MIEFTAAGSPRDVSRIIEEYARATGRVNALVVPWESDATALSMAVTSVKADGWAIEHSDVGTIRLTDLGDDSTAVAIAARNPEPAGQPGLVALFERFAAQLQRHLTQRPDRTSREGQPGQP
jgi:hypothetical protein